ncbi:MarR family transcriptional regulator [Flavitalea sp. BT771]|uniref:MarR family winged helix-turn-helix transcriptional regulator n=1 Tax=Flavitalea sp. BT771 TaxID=3063329 RepID=UPI0026E3C5F5|nr:MarR family transcriptional regulator [Flavitalea sp. BT771]MDO6433643.1 MarR family transcriptional regulator [Flavitalea sp. BT771]MDV6222452.1 MarR family transcriptional regulator [Flavitalea sp. BT771]
MSSINPSLRLLMNLFKIQAMMARKFDRLTMHGIGFNDFLILYLLQQGDEKRLRPTDLAEKTGLTASGVTRMLLPMEKIGLIARQANERDARVSFVTITVAGKRIYEEAMETANMIAKDIVPVEYGKNSLSLASLLKALGGNIS